MIEVEKIVGKVKAEEEPEGQVIAGPTGEAVELLSSGNIPLSFLRNQVSSFFIQFHCCIGSPFFQKLIH